MSRPLLLIALLGSLTAAAAALAQQPVRPLPKVGGCPLGYDSSGSYCVPSTSGNTRGALEKTGSSCPLGFYSSGNYCLSSPTATARRFRRPATPARSAGSARAVTASRTAEHLEQELGLGVLAFSDTVKARLADTAEPGNPAV